MRSSIIGAKRRYFDLICRIAETLRIVLGSFSCPSITCISYCDASAKAAHDLIHKLLSTYYYRGNGGHYCALCSRRRCGNRRNKTHRGKVALGGFELPSHDFLGL